MVIVPPFLTAPDAPPDVVGEELLDEPHAATAITEPIARRAARADLNCLGILSPLRSRLTRQGAGPGSCSPNLIHLPRPAGLFNEPATSEKPTGHEEAGGRPGGLAPAVGGGNDTLAGLAAYSDAAVLAAGRTGGEVPGKRALAVLGAAMIGLLWCAPAAQARGSGCAGDRHAVAYRAGGIRVRPQPSGAPIPCGMQTGFAGGESAIAVTNSGAVFYAPAAQTFAGTQAQYFLGGNSGFARTTNQGAKWSFVAPISFNVAPDVGGLPGQRFSNSLGYPAWDQIDDKFYMDRRTGRLFWTDPDVPSEAVLWTDNDGLTWGYSLLPVGFGGEWTQITTARPRISKTSGYPEVVYACGEYDSVGRDASTSFEGDLCQKSLNGGQSWTVAGQGLFGSPIATHRRCRGKTESPDFSPWAAPDPQGRLYELLFCDGKTYLLRSSNEGATWPIAVRVPYRIPNAGPGGTGSAELRTDARG